MCAGRVCTRAGRRGLWGHGHRDSVHPPSPLFPFPWEWTKGRVSSTGRVTPSVSRGERSRTPLSPNYRPSQGSGGDGNGTRVSRRKVGLWRSSIHPVRGTSWCQTPLLGPFTLHKTFLTLFSSPPTSPPGVVPESESSWEAPYPDPKRGLT